MSRGRAGESREHSADTPTPLPPTHTSEANLDDEFSDHVEERRRQVFENAEWTAFLIESLHPRILFRQEVAQHRGVRGLVC